MKYRKLKKNRGSGPSVPAAGTETGHDRDRRGTADEAASLDDRVRRAVASELSGERAYLLGQVGRKDAASPALHRPKPSQWRFWLVADRLEEAFSVLRRMPVATRPRGHATAWPSYRYDRFDLNAQMESGELERLLHLQNRVVIQPTAAEIAQMEASLQWPISYLSDAPELARAVLFSSMWPNSYMERVTEEFGVSRRAFQRRRLHGLQVVAAGLNRDRIPVS